MKDNELLKRFKVTGKNVRLRKTCCFCGKGIVYGNNPHPLTRDPDARCCDECNILVISARQRELHQAMAKAWQGGDK